MSLSAPAEPARRLLGSCCALFQGDLVVPTPAARAGFAGAARLASSLVSRFARHGRGERHLTGQSRS
jgi:hypothetical protein